MPTWGLKFGAFLQEKITFRHWIAISMKNGFARGKYLYPAHYALLYFTKGIPSSFNRPKIPAPKCRKCGEYVKDYGGYKEYIRNGINLSDIWEDFSPVRHHKYKNRTSNELPIEFLRRIISISGKKNGVIIDPFVGSGTSILAAVETNMYYIASDREQMYCDTALSRLTKFKQNRSTN